MNPDMVKLYLKGPALGGAEQSQLRLTSLNMLNSGSQGSLNTSHSPIHSEAKFFQHTVMCTTADEHSLLGADHQWV